MLTYSKQSKWDEAKRDFEHVRDNYADGDTRVAIGILAAQVIHELEDSRSRIEAVAEQLERRSP